MFADSPSHGRAGCKCVASINRMVNDYGPLQTSYRGRSRLLSFDYHHSRDTYSYGQPLLMKSQEGSWQAGGLVCMKDEDRIKRLASPEIDIRLACSSDRQELSTNRKTFSWSAEGRHKPRGQWRRHLTAWLLWSMIEDGHCLPCLEAPIIWEPHHEMAKCLACQIKSLPPLGVRLTFFFLKFC